MQNDMLIDLTVILDDDRVAGEVGASHPAVGVSATLSRIVSPSLDTDTVEGVRPPSRNQLGLAALARKLYRFRHDTYTGYLHCSSKWLFTAFE